MPIYVYEHVGPVGDACAERFERIESITAEVLDACPTCGGPVRRVPSRFASPKDVLAPSNLKEKGFTTLRRRDKGVYEAD